MDGHCSGTGARWSFPQLTSTWPVGADGSRGVDVSSERCLHGLGPRGAPTGRTLNPGAMLRPSPRCPQGRQAGGLLAACAREPAQRFGLCDLQAPLGRHSMSAACPQPGGKTTWDPRRARL